MTRRKGASMIVDETDGSDLPVLSRDDAGLVRPQATTPTEGLSRLSLEQAVSLLIAEREAYIDPSESSVHRRSLRTHLEAEGLSN